MVLFNTKLTTFCTFFCFLLLIFGNIPAFSQGQQFTAEQIMRALAQAHPQAITRVEFRNGDWAVLMRGTWFYYAQGRLLSEQNRTQVESWGRQSFYSYPAELPPWQEPEGERADRLRNVLNNRRENPPRRNPDFFDTLWQASTRDEASSRMVQMRFLGKNITVHRDLEGRLRRIDQLIQEEARTNREVQEFINELGPITAWNWRNVAITVSRSFHSYGTAIDILPANLRGRATYWQWNAGNNSEWFRIPYTRRWHPPDSVIKIFERFGFCWGGKWPLFDTMHFEYRPEILLLHGMRVEN